jgi:hypothetical protein
VLRDHVFEGFADRASPNLDRCQLARVLAEWSGNIDPNHTLLMMPQSGTKVQLLAENS